MQYPVTSTWLIELKGKLCNSYYCFSHLPHVWLLQWAVKRWSSNNGAVQSKWIHLFWPMSKWKKRFPWNIMARTLIIGCWLFYYLILKLFRYYRAGKMLLGDKHDKVTLDFLNDHLARELDEMRYERSCKDKIIKNIIFNFYSLYRNNSFTFTKEIPCWQNNFFVGTNWKLFMEKGKLFDTGEALIQYHKVVDTRV